MGMKLVKKESVSKQLRNDHKMKIWVDGDACPKVIKEILFRMAERTKIETIFVANAYLRLPHSDYLKMIQVADGADIADDKIVECCGVDDLIITADIPLADRVIKKGAIALDPRGKLYNNMNIGSILSMRNFMDDLRSTGIETGGPNSFTPKERQKFANELDTLLARRFKK